MPNQNIQNLHGDYHPLDALLDPDPAPHFFRSPGTQFAGFFYHTSLFLWNVAKCNYESIILFNFISISILNFNMKWLSNPCKCRPIYIGPKVG